MMLGSKFLRLWSAYTISTIGDWAYRLAIPIVIFDLTQSAFWMSAAYAANFAPFILVMPFGGVIADTIDRQKILWISDIISAFVALAICFYLYLGGTNIYALLPGFVALGMLASISHPAFQGMIPSIVEENRLARANSLITSSDSVLNMGAPIVSGVLIAIVGAYSILWFNAASFLVSSALIYSIKIRGSVAIVKKSFREIKLKQDLKDGYNIAMSYPLIMWGTYLFILVNFSSHLILGNIIYYLTEALTLSASDAGLVLGLSAGGAAIGAISAPYFIKKFHSGKLMLFCVALSAIGTSTLLLSSSIGITAVLIGRGLTTAAEATIVVTMFTERQRLLPSEYLSRTVAITRTISYVPVPIAAISGGYLLSAFGGNMNILIVTSAAVLAACVMIGFFTPFVSDAIFSSSSSKELSCPSEG